VYSIGEWGATSPVWAKGGRWPPVALRLMGIYATPAGPQTNTAVTVFMNTLDKQEGLEKSRPAGG